MSRSDELTRIAGILGTEVSALDHLEPLDEAGLARLADLLDQSLGAEEERVDTALRATMRFLPRPLRGRARAVLFPEEHR